MYAMLKVTQNIIKLSEGRVFLLTFSDPNLKSLVLSLNKEQLIAGELSDESFLPEYSEASVNTYGKRRGRWTLHDTGQLQDSFKILKVTEDAIIEYGDLIKEETDFNQMFDGAVLGLNGESLSILINEAIPIMRDVLLKEMLKRN